MSKSFRRDKFDDDFDDEFGGAGRRNLRDRIRTARREYHETRVERHKRETYETGREDS